MYKGQGLSHGRLSDLPLLGIPRLWGIIASPRPKHAALAQNTNRKAAVTGNERNAGGLSEGCPLLSEQEITPAVPGIVARVRPRASKGITDLLLLSVSDGFRAVDPSKKNLRISGGLGVRLCYHHR